MRTPTILIAFLSVLGVGACCDEPRLPPYPCVSADPGGIACDTLTDERCSATEAPSTCPSDIAPDPSFGCDWRGLCADDPNLALWCCSEKGASSAAPLPPFPPNPGDGACRPMDWPGDYGCLPAWFVTGLASLPGGCQSCSAAGEEAWVCEDLNGKYPVNGCVRLGDAPYQESGFYCCSCTI